MYWLIFHCLFDVQLLTIPECVLLSVYLKHLLLYLLVCSYKSSYLVPVFGFLSYRSWVPLIADMMSKHPEQIPLILSSYSQLTLTRKSTMRFWFLLCFSIFRFSSFKQLLIPEEERQDHPDKLSFHPLVHFPNRYNS